MKTKEFYNDRGQIIGRLENDTYHFKRESGKHFFVIGGGYPISTSVIESLKESGCQKVRLTEITKKGIKIREADLKHYDTAQEYQVGGFDKQKCMPLKNMITINE